MEDDRMDLLEVVYQDGDIVVVNKPSGLLSIPGRGVEKLDSVSHRVRGLYPDCIKQPAVHRLDMDTSGLMVLAFSSEGHRDLSIQFLERQVYKRYVAILDGLLDLDSGRIELPFRLDVDNRPFQIYDEEHGKVGITEWRRLSVEGGMTRVEFEPLTGRTHQLRVHSAHERGLGVPIVGDPFYGNALEGVAMKLHATELRFRHPFSGDTMSFHSEPMF